MATLTTESSRATAKGGIVSGVPDDRFPALAATLTGFAARQRYILGLAEPHGPRSGVLRVSRADTAEFEIRLAAAYDKHYASLVAYARRRGADRLSAKDAEDVVQRAFENVWQRRTRPAEISNIDAYIQTAVRHETWRELARARDDLTRYGGDPAELGVLPCPGGGTADQVVDRLTLRRLLDRLATREREAVVLRVIWDLSVRETADVMGISQGAVKRYCADGLHRLNDWLQAA
jgi:RNA polymerase sigma factor (sigma-70 family)